METLPLIVRMRDIALEAGGILIDQQSKSRKVSERPNDFSTSGDQISQGWIGWNLSQDFPHIPVYFEEGGQQKEPKGLQFVVDQLDGSKNHHHRDDFWGISIGLVDDGKPFLGLIYLPGKGQVFSSTPEATYACTAIQRWNGRVRPSTTIRLRVSEEKNLKTANVWIDPPKGPPLGDPELFRTCRTAIENASVLPETRVCCTASMMQIVLGKIDAYVLQPQPEDVAAAIPIVERMGGKVTNLRGEPFDIFSRGVMVASNSKIHDALLEVLNRAVGKK